MKTTISILLLLGTLLSGTTSAESPPNLSGKLVTLETPEGVRFGIWGNQVKYPAPTLLVFSASIEDSLEDPYYRQCGNALAEHGFLCVSVDLPGHGNDHQADEPGGLSTWRVRSDQGKDFVTPFTDQVSGVLDHLIATGYTEAERIAACGTSRGGFMALQVTAADCRIRATAAFAPVTALTALREFHEVANPEHVDSLSLNGQAEQLLGRSLWLVIGDRDDRVGTDKTIALARLVTTKSLALSKSADVTLLVKPEPKGHTTPAGSPEAAADWILEKLQ